MFDFKYRYFRYIADTDNHRYIFSARSTVFLRAPLLMSLCLCFLLNKRRQSTKMMSHCDLNNWTWLMTSVFAFFAAGHDPKTVI
jgi:type III secretory pathway component EscU